MSLHKFIPVAVTFSCALFSFAQEAQPSADEASSGEPSAKKVVVAAKFTTLPVCSYCEGFAEVKIPDGEWVPVLNGKFYPLGSSFRTREGGSLTLSFGNDSFAKISGEASFSTRAQEIGEKSRTIVLGSGTLELNLAANLPEGAFFVTAPGFAVRNPAGESRYTYEKTSYGDRAVVRCVTGSLALSGRHFDVAEMCAADELVLSCEHDNLVTILENTSGDYLVRLEQGSRLRSEVSAEGVSEQKEVSEKTEIKLFPKMKINIHRAVPSVGERMSVFIIAFDAAGNPMGPGVSFCEGRAEISAGEIVVKEEAEKESADKKAAEAAETTETAADVGEQAEKETTTSAE